MSISYGRWLGRCGLAAGLALMVCAPSAGAAVSQQQAGTQHYDIAAGRLSLVLSQFAARAGILLVADGRLTGDLRSPGLRGDFTVEQAFERLLQGSGLEPARIGAGFTLQPVRAAAANPLEDETPAAVPPAPVRPVPGTLPTVLARATRLGEGYRGEGSLAATRTDTATLALPLSLSIITPQLLQDQAASSLAQVLQWAPGVSMAQGEGNRETPVLRGTSSVADFLVDGIRDDEQYYRDLYNIERVEVLKGPNAMIFGYGGAGGVINRVTKQPDWQARSELQLHFGSWADQRASVDLGRPLSAGAALRLNAMVEQSNGFRDGFRLQRSGVNPSMALRLDADTLLTLGYEHYQDWRTADRGIPSYQGRPVQTDPSTFFGNPGASVTWLNMDAWSALLERELGGGASLRSRLRVAHYDKFFQNVFPGAVRELGDGLGVVISAHNSRTRRSNLFSQTDVTLPFEHSGVRHLVLAGLELGRQFADNRRMSGYFGGDASVSSLLVPLASPQVDTPVAFAASATDPNNRSRSTVAALYLQDQVQLTPQWSVVAGLRRDQLVFDLTDRRSDTSLTDRSALWSPRLSVIYQPLADVSLYATRSVGHQPRSAEQLLTLALDSRSLAPEKFVNLELGAKWALGARLEASAAFYQVDRYGVAVADPVQPALLSRLVDGQRSRGVELGLNGELVRGWQAVAGYAFQDSRLRESFSSVAQRGARMPHVPRHSFSWWNRVELSPLLAAGLGLVARSSLFTSLDNTVALPGFARLDGALYFTPGPGLRLQLNVENLLGRRYYASAHSNSNISPGAPRSFRLGLSAAF